MKTVIIAGVAAIGLALNAGAALAQTQSTMRPTVGDGTNLTQPSLRSPGYNVGTASAQIGDGTNSPKVPTTTPGYTVGSGSAHIGDGTNSPAALTTAPGYSVGTGSAKTADSQYKQGSADKAKTQ